MKDLEKEDRLDIPIIPRCILKQKLMLQKALIDLAYGKKMQSALRITKMLKVGKYYDTNTRIEALQTLKHIMEISLKPEVYEKYDELKNIDKMLDHFKEDRYKNLVILAENSTDSYFNIKKEYMLEIFDKLKNNDKVSLISVSSKVKVIYSL
jgi:hypothetical protein